MGGHRAKKLTAHEKLCTLQLEVTDREKLVPEPIPPGLLPEDVTYPEIGQEVKVSGESVSITSISVRTFHKKLEVVVGLDNGQERLWIPLCREQHV